MCRNWFWTTLIAAGIEPVTFKDGDRPCKADVITTTPWNLKFVIARRCFMPSFGFFCELALAIESFWCVFLVICYHPVRWTRAHRGSCSFIRSDDHSTRLSFYNFYQLSFWCPILSSKNALEYNIHKLIFTIHKLILKQFDSNRRNHEEPAPSSALMTTHSCFLYPIFPGLPFSSCRTVLWKLSQIEQVDILRFRIAKFRFLLSCL